MPLELYIHIPFCVRKCNYCDFLSFPAGEEVREAYCRALLEEIRRTAAFLKDNCILPVTSIFFGGGTPSVLQGDQISRILGCLRQEFPIEADAEISIEANPGTMDESKLDCWREAGINRLSIGLQSTDDFLLATLGRIHSFRQFEENYHLAREMGFDNINVDLMSALPGQTLEDYRETLRIVTGLRPEHISSYSLIIEEGTPLAKNRELLGMLPDEDTDRKMYELTKEYLGSCGYHRYEISNYALPGKECRHNKGYWEGIPYLGFGLGASSYYNHARFSNTTDLKEYLKNSFTPFEKRADYEKQTLRQEMEDWVIFGLRMTRGISVKEFEKRFERQFEEVYGNVIREYEDMGLFCLSDGRVKLTDRGIDVSNIIFEGLLLDERE